ncbi:hypothetical protein [Alicyclobacillus mengziensis]|uniref:Secreted protein n=1 Tax=Alicyclobacillus mengziensis TaxID=2931921 RepID=A0A9X7VXC3_9BACL|nr:hypothetical protein [Alicyclobacillus mengziensis]QSO46749.1 hypothetical protein JZ786_20270 [Alicyclobacillus mengziensis]
MKRYKQLSIAVVVSMVAILAGCATADNGTAPASNTSKQTSTINPPGNLLPSLVKWNGISYITTGYIHNVGAKVGVANDGTQKWNVFVLPGYSPQNEIAVEVNNPNGKYVEANAPVTGQNSPLIVDYYNHGYGVILKLVPPKSIGKEIYKLHKIDEIIAGDGGTFPIGTKLFAIKGVPVNKSIAVEINTNTYLQANLRGWFPPSSNTSS